MSITVIGEEELQKAFGVLPVKLRNRIMRPSLRRGAYVVAEAMEAEARAALTKSGSPAPHLAEFFHVRARKTRRVGSVGIVIWTGRKSELEIPETTKDGQPRGYYPTAIEYGWRPSRRGTARKRQKLRATLKKHGTDRGGITAATFAQLELGSRAVPANPFMHRAIDASKTAAFDAIAAEAAERLAKLQTATFEKILAEADDAEIGDEVLA